MKKTFMLFMFLACLAASPPARAGEAGRVKIAILPFDSSLASSYDALRDGMPDMLTACFTAHAEKAEILDRSALADIAAEATQNFDIRKIHLDAATHILRGSLVPEGDGFLLTLMLYDLHSAKLAASATAAGGDGEAPDVACRGVDALAQKLDGLEKPGTGAAQTEEQKKEARRAAKQGRLMMEGLGYYYNGAYEQAFPAFMKLLRDAPNNAGARYWLGMSYRAAGMEDSARIEFKKFTVQFPKDPRAAEVAAYLQGEPDDKKKE